MWHTWENNIKMVVEEMRWEDVEWMYMAWDRYWWEALVNMTVYSLIRQGLS
jgi:hypothetical protein